MDQEHPDSEGNMPNGMNSGVVRSIAYRPHSGEEMTELKTCEVLAGRGLTVEDRPAGQREVTFLSIEAWEQACRELGTDLPWTTRRTNLLVTGVNLPAAVGRTIEVGGVRIEIHGESKPCALMDRQHEGLRQSLVPDGRGGVFGQVIEGGTIRVGDSVTVGAR